MIRLVLIVPLVVAVLAGCKEIAATEEEGYQPASVEEAIGDDGGTVTFTQEGADRVGLRTVTVDRVGDHVVVPYAALIYDAAGSSWVYVTTEPLTYQRVEVAVDRTEGDRAYVGNGVDEGDTVVTVGATQVYGAELGIAGGH